jgi:hypothetical protein
MMPKFFFNKTQEWSTTLTQSGKGSVFFQNTLVRTLLILALFPILVSLGLLAYFIRPSEASLVLHYNVYFGVDLLGIWWQAYTLPLLALGFLLAHFFLARRFYEQSERIACYLLLLASGMLSCGVMIGSISIAFINY